MAKLVTLIVKSRDELGEDGSGKQISSLTPYKYEEIFTVPEDVADKLLTRNMEKDEFGRPKNPIVKVKRFDPKKLEHQRLLLKNKVLNQRAHNMLLLEIGNDEEKEDAKAEIDRLDREAEALKERQVERATRLLEGFGLTVSAIKPEKNKF